MAAAAGFATLPSGDKNSTRSTDNVRGGEEKRNEKKKKPFLKRVNRILTGVMITYRRSDRIARGPKERQSRDWLIFHPSDYTVG